MTTETIDTLIVCAYQAGIAMNEHMRHLDVPDHHDRFPGLAFSAPIRTGMNTTRLQRKVKT